MTNKQRSDELLAIAREARALELDVVADQAALSAMTLSWLPDEMFADAEREQNRKRIAQEIVDRFEDRLREADALIKRASDLRRIAEAAIRVMGNS